MKNHLSKLGSTGAGGRFSPLGRGGSWSGLTQPCEWLTVRFVLFEMSAWPYAGLTTQKVRDDGGTIQGNSTRVGFAGDQLLPRFSSFTDNIGGISENGLLDRI
jgi:hypothetical protein